MATGTRSLRPVEGLVIASPKRPSRRPQRRTILRRAFLWNPSISKPVELGRERLAGGSIRWAIYAITGAFTSTSNLEIMFELRSAIEGGGFNNTELVATLRICSSPGEIRPNAHYSMRSSASVLQLLIAQTNC
jgi:hypothetical protein